jgi:hypothetical protein
MKFETSPLPESCSENDHLLLKKCESTIKRGIKHFFEVGEALATIRDKRLYKLSGFKTFDSSLTEKWKFTRQYASKLVTTFYLNKDLSTSVDKEIPPSQAMAFRQLPAEAQDRLKKLSKDGNDIRAEITVAEKKFKSAYVQLKGHISKITTILTTDHEDDQKILEAIEDLLIVATDYKLRRQAKLVKLQQDAEFDKAA